jgi:predicted ester cyclase
MGITDNERLLNQYIREVWEKGNPEAVGLFAAEGFLRHGRPGTQPLDRAGQIERLKSFQAAFPDISIEVDDAITGDDYIAFRSTMRGTHRGELMGIGPTGRQVTVQLVDMIRVEDGKFVEQWGGPDMLDLLSQLGATVHTGSFEEEE